MEQAATVDLTPKLSADNHVAFIHDVKDLIR
jgi:hypothetical protein